MSGKRTVEPVPDFLEEVLADFQSPPIRCVEGAHLLLEELEDHDPDLDERCGLLADRYEIYAMAIPRCSGHALVISLDITGPRPQPCAVHGLLSRSRSVCDTGRLRATRHFKLVDPSWEPSHG